MEDNQQSVALDFTELDFTRSKDGFYRDFKYYYQSDARGFKYSKEQIRRFLSNPLVYERQIREVSIYLAGSSSHYLRLATYLATMLTLDHLVIPTNPPQQEDNGFNRVYSDVVKYIENYNIKHEINKILPVLLIEDSFFGYEQTNTHGTTIRRLPNNYCKIIGVEDGIFVFAFNFGYFQGREEILDSFPIHFRRLYHKAIKTGILWQELSPQKGAVCFKLRDDLSYSFPLFAPIFEEIISLEQKKDREDEKEELENFKLLVQKIPFKKEPKSEKDFLMTLPSVKKFHNNIKSTLPKNVGLISTPMDIQDYSFEKKSGSSNKANIPEAQEILFTSAGWSSSIFSSQNKTKTAQDNAMISDESLMFGLLRQLERFFNNRLYYLFKSPYDFNVMFLDITHFNRDREVNKYLKMAQFGYPKSLVAVAMGFSQSQFLGLNTLENRLLKLEDKLVPLNSSHTGGAAATVSSNEHGRPSNDTREANPLEQDLNK